jgi:preprotein translocase subunit SecD
MLRFAVVLMLLVSGSVCLGSAKKPPPMSFRMHVESHSRDGDTFTLPLTVGNPPRQITVEKMPMITEREVKAFHPFASPGGQGVAVYLQLDAHGQNALEQITTSKRDQYLVTVFNGRPLARMKIDRPIRDGIVYVPGGIFPEEIQQMGLRLPLIGESPQETKKRQKARQVLP